MRLSARSIAAPLSAVVLLGSEPFAAAQEQSAPAPVAAPAPAPAGATQPAPPPSEEPHGYRTAAFIGLGVAAVAFGFSAAYGADALSKRNDARGSCPGASVCATQQGVNRWNDAETSAGISTLSFLIGCAGLLEAAVFWFTPAPASLTDAHVGVGPGGVRLSGRW
jgi:hypothetical protein